MPYSAHDDSGPAFLPEAAEEAHQAEAREPEEAGAEARGEGKGAREAGGQGARRRPLVVRETAPLVGSDGSSEDGAPPESHPAGKPRAHELRARIQACEREQRRLRAEYGLEVQHCADLREALEAREQDLAAARAPLQVQLREAREALEHADRAECGAAMRIEDDVAHCARLLESKDREIDDLERRLHGMQQSYQKFLRDGPPKDAVVEEALRAADKEMSELLSGVQLRERVIASLNADLRSALEYMISANLEAAGGPSPELGLEDLLPVSVRDHLGLSEHGATHLQILFKKYELMMAELRRATPPSAKLHDRSADAVLSDQISNASTKDAGARHANWQTSDLDSSRRSSQAEEYPSDMAAAGGPRTPLEAGLEEISPGAAAPTLAASLMPDPAMMNSASEALAQMMPALSDVWGQQEDPDGAEEAFVAPLVAVALDEDEDVWALGAEEASPSTSSRAAPPPLGGGGAASASLEEEGRILRGALAQELRQLAVALAPVEGAGDAQRAGRELRRAAAQGDAKAVRTWLARTADSSQDARVFLGWTPWHVAAAYGQCAVLECLKEDLFDRATHHLAALDRRTRLGLPPLGVACLTGRVDAARCLVLGMAPVDARDARGNTPLMWAAIGGQARALVPLLLDARADPEAANGSGQRPDVSGLMSGCSVATLTRPDLGAPGLATSPSGSPGDSSRRSAGQEGPERFGEAYHCIRTIGAEPPKEPGLLSYALGMLKASSRDAVGFMQNAKAKQHAHLNAAEVDAGVWSEWVTNYTHAGLHAAVEVGRENADPLLPHRSSQVLVLTCERLLLLNGRSWSLAQVIALSELAEVAVSSFSSSVLILRMHRLPDVVLDVAVDVRARLLDELQLAAGTVAAEWGGADFGGSLRIRHECEPVVELLDERRKRAGTLAYIEAHVFLLLPYAPNSLLLAGGDTFFFGLLDVHQSRTAARGAPAGSASLGWKWQTYFFILKSGSGEGRKLMWCQHPNDERCLGSVHVGRLLAVQPLDTPQGEACLIIDYGADEQAHALTLRASSAQNREDWIVSLRTMQTGL